MTEHIPGIRTAQKMDTPTGLYAGTCSCGWSGGVNSKKGARVAAEQHARDKNRNE